MRVLREENDREILKRSIGVPEVTAFRGQYDTNRIMEYGMRKYGGTWSLRDIENSRAPCGETPCFWGFVGKKWLSFVEKNKLSNAFEQRCFTEDQSTLA